ncbi:MAG: PKD domain-containing protein [Prevotellaceae bacterium]|jgi:PKD repeat protein|nr:PKD domain-containing protein [Prevotellaceae bacterium]
MKQILLLVLTALCLQNCYREQAVSITVDFVLTVEDSDYSVPSRILLENKSTGADNYKWTFEGGTPASSDRQHPDAVLYRNAGTYTVRLEAWNDDERKSKEYILQLDSAVYIDFEIEIPVNNISPVQALISNKSSGGHTYHWTFVEDGETTSSNLYNPPPVSFTEAGEHTVTLEISNGRETFVLSKNIVVLPAMSLDFDIIPSFDDEDMEAPFTAVLQNQSVNGLQYQWVSENGYISNDTATVTTTVKYNLPGAYAITLNADNGKEIKSISKTIVVKPNSNLYIMKDVKLGIKPAHASIGSFYSCALRKVITRDEVDAQNGQLIDFAFFGLDETFRYCRILSPDSVGNYAFYDIPDARHTSVINVLENSPIVFDETDFDSMENDDILAVLPVAENDSGEEYFTADIVPRIILFETDDGRKGAVKIKDFVSENLESYILIDLKVQKNKIKL